MLRPFTIGDNFNMNIRYYDTRSLTRNKPELANILAKLSSPAGCPWTPVSSSPVVPAPAALELVEDAVVFVERAQLTPEVFVNLRGEGGL